MEMLENNGSATDPVAMGRVTVATWISIIVHFFGVIGILCWDRTFFIQATAANLLLGFILVLWTAMPLEKGWWACTIAAFLVGMGVEWMGVQHAWLFGHYVYGRALGPSLDGVPWVIGLNWCIGMWAAFSVKNITRSANAPGWLLAVFSASLLVLFDALIEPAAAKLGFWTWRDGFVPWTNYGSWFVISGVLQLFFRAVFSGRRNQFAIRLLVIQGIFFVVLDLFL